MQPIVRVPRITGTQSHKVGQTWDYEGYLILIIALVSIYLNPYDDIANRSSEGVSQACTDNSSAHKVQERPHAQGVILNEPCHYGVDLGVIVQESHASHSTDSYPDYVLNPVPLIKGARIQKGSLCLTFYALGSHPGIPLAGSPLFEGPRLFSLVPSPLFSLNVSLF